MLEQIENGEGIREILSDAIKEFHTKGPINLAVLEVISLIKVIHPETFSEYEEKLISVMGLFYKQVEPSSVLEAIYKDLGDAIEQKFGRTFTPMQATAYKAIHEKHFYSFSAPTSTGKSYLFRELVKDYDKDIVIVVPSRALIAEFYSVVIDLVQNDVLVLQFIENINQHNTSRRIFIITPERGIEIFKYGSDFDVGMFLFDEAQISEEPVRGLSFDAFVRRTEREFPNATKVFAHPFVSNPKAQFIKHGFVENYQADSFKQSNVGKIFVTLEEDGSFKVFSPYTDTDEIKLDNDIISSTLDSNGTVLIYSSKAKIFDGRHIEEYGQYIEQCPPIDEPEALKFVSMLEKYIGSSETQLGKQSSFIQLMKRGVVVHHGSMPLKARLLIENFVRNGYAKLCFATSTLNQGINMPFDCVLIDNFVYMNELTLKNLIGRSGRSTDLSKFDFGYTIVRRENVKTFSSRLSSDVVISETSKLDDDIKNIPEDFTDLVEAVKTDTFNDDLHLTNSQVERIRAANLRTQIKFVLDKLIDGEKAITGNQYYALGDPVRRQVKDKLKTIYCSHLRRSKLLSGEQAVLSAAIPLLLWKVQGKSFSETLSLRHSYLTQRDERRKLARKLRENEVEQSEYNKKLKRLKIKYSAQAEKLPNSRLTKSYPLFPGSMSVRNFDYDRLVYDTYDYLDKVISLSLADPICAALAVYYEETGDERSKVLSNYLRFGTNDETEIWLLKYGFDPEDVEWIATIVAHVDENGIVFIDDLSGLTDEQNLIIKRYV
ncbi:DEAD/DEAH box helicase [Salinimonas chungwhensis]|uniref:DEAD/DEAH box helicase n=1 Tax=Salinimonas chungwhensis TaxID=265425 RepID=UPI00037B9F25|nr:DEAD/DEAH box helicase [Salinimonas chungwhensis]